MTPILVASGIAVGVAITVLSSFAWIAWEATQLDDDGHDR